MGMRLIRLRLQRDSGLWGYFLCVSIMFLLGGLQGCTTLSGQREDGVAKGTAAGEAKFFTLKGRLSVRVAQRLETGQITWSRAANEERLEIFTPFGSQVAEIVRTGSQVVMRKGSESIVAESIGALTGELLGVPLDLDVIASWTQGRGLVDGETREISLVNGELWLVTAERFQARDAHRFASRLSAVRGDTVVRLVIDEWQSR